MTNTIIEKAWLESANDYQQRIPNPTQGAISNTINALFDPLNNDLWNQFTNKVMNAVGRRYVHSRSFTNPLREFKKDSFIFGKTLEHRAVDFIKAHAYTDDAETLLKTARPDWLSWFVTVSRQDRYDISINQPEWYQAVSAGDDGITSLVAGTLTAQVNSDEYDEMNIMLQLITEANQRWGGMFTVTVTEPTDKATAQAFLTEARAIAGQLRFPSKMYNNLTVPVWASPEELILFVTPRINAVIDVMGLADLFNASAAEIPYRKVLVPEGSLPNGAFAFLTTSDFFDCHDTNYKITQFYNAERDDVKYFLHHWGIYAASPLVPAILFSTEETEIPELELNATGINLAIDKHGDANLQPGGSYQLTASLQGTADAPLELEPDAVTYEVSFAASMKNTRTYIDRNGVLHIQSSGVTSGDTITIKATSTYDASMTKTITATMA